ncbi:MAG: potassium channel protein [Bacteroidota bacterium]|nr:potassium channel protein [Bacteroidota bacterium]
MSKHKSSENETIFKRLRFTGLLFLIVLVGGAIGYHLVEPEYTLFEGLYMTVITIATIGYGEIVDMSNNVSARIYTMVLSFAGIGVLTYFVSNLASIIIEGNLNESFKMKKMEKRIKKLNDHYIVCGCGNVGVNIVNELIKTKRSFILAGIEKDQINNLIEINDDFMGLIGDPTDDEFLIQLGITKAKGIFVNTGDDNINLVVCVSAKHLNPNITLVSECLEINNIEKLKIAGADKVISPTFIGGLRMASEMIRPTVTGFLDEMMRGTNDELRVEEINISSKYAGKTLADLNIETFKKTVLLSIREDGKWIYHPEQGHILKETTTLIIMTTPKDRISLEEHYS